MIYIVYKVSFESEDEALRDETVFYFEFCGEMKHNLKRLFAPLTRNRFKLKLVEVVASSEKVLFSLIILQ